MTRFDPYAPLMDATDLTVRYRWHENWLGKTTSYVNAVNCASFSLRRGEILSLVGESGCGKSTLGRALVGLVDPWSGNIRYRGIDLKVLLGARQSDIRRKIQLVAQDPQSSLDPRMPIWRSITEGLRIHSNSTAGALRKKASEVAALVGVEESQLNGYPHELSGGQRQRVAIGRAIAVDPEVLVLDEPTSALDVSIQAQILNLLLSMRSELGLSYLFISHDLSVVRHVSDRIAVMYLGQIVEYGESATLLQNPQHPYTQLLLETVPVIGRCFDSANLMETGEPPSNKALPSGCFFRSRCRYSVRACERKQSLQSDDQPGEHLIRCQRAINHTLPVMKELPTPSQ